MVGGGEKANSFIKQNQQITCSLRSEEPATTEANLSGAFKRKTDTPGGGDRNLKYTHLFFRGLGGGDEDHFGGIGGLTRAEFIKRRGLVSPREIRQFVLANIEKSGFSAPLKNWAHISKWHPIVREEELVLASTGLLYSFLLSVFRC